MITTSKTVHKTVMVSLTLVGKLMALLRYVRHRTRSFATPRVWSLGTDFVLPCHGRIDQLDQEIAAKGNATRVSSFRRLTMLSSFSIIIQPMTLSACSYFSTLRSSLLALCGSLYGSCKERAIIVKSNRLRPFRLTQETAVNGF